MVNKSDERMPSKAEIFEHWKNSKEHLIIDWYEPECWACGQWWGGKYDLDLSKTGTGDEVLKKIWNSVPLQRCHIVARSLGGTNDVNNLFLMCSECHDLAPNTKSRELFLKWAKSQSDRRLIQMQKTIENFNLTERFLIEMGKYIGTEEFKKWTYSNTSLHRNQASGGSVYTTSTHIAALIEFTALKKPKIKRYKEQ